VYRLAKKLTQQQLAERVGVSRFAIGKIESGKSVPSVVLALCIAQALDTPVDRIFKLGN
jgi:putative transcriptional regulator